MIKNHIDILYYIVNINLIGIFCFSISLLHDDDAIKGSIWLSICFVIFIIIFVARNRYLEKWHKWYSRKEGKYILRRQIWDRCISGEIYSSFEYAPYPPIEIIKWH